MTSRCDAVPDGLVAHPEVTLPSLADQRHLLDRFNPNRPADMDRNLIGEFPLASDHALHSHVQTRTAQSLQQRLRNFIGGRPRGTSDPDYGALREYGEGLGVVAGYACRL